MDYYIETKSVPTFYFIGVTTGNSSINKVFPLWMDVLDRKEVILEGIDHNCMMSLKTIGDPLLRSNMIPCLWEL